MKEMLIPLDTLVFRTLRSSCEDASDFLLLGDLFVDGFVEAFLLGPFDPPGGTGATLLGVSVSDPQEATKSRLASSSLSFLEPLARLLFLTDAAVADGLSDGCSGISSWMVLRLTKDGRQFPFSTAAGFGDINGFRLLGCGVRYL